MLFGSSILHVGQYMIDLRKLNEIADTCADGFRIRSFDGSRMTMVGSFDHCYYHNVEVVFIEVAYCSCPTDMMDVKFRMADRAERKRMKELLDMDEDDQVYCIEADAGVGDKTFMIVAIDATMREELVKYHEPNKVLQ